MTITIELAPELQAELARQTATQGAGVDAYAACLIESSAVSRCAGGCDFQTSVIPLSRDLDKASETL